MNRMRLTPRLVAQALIEAAGETAANPGAFAEAALHLLEKYGLTRDIPRFSRTVATMFHEREGTKNARLTVGHGDPTHAAMIIGEILQRARGGPWHVHVGLDQSLIGGGRLRIGDDQIDASLRAELHQLASHLAL